MIDPGQGALRRTPDCPSAGQLIRNAFADGNTTIASDGG